MQRDVFVKIQRRSALSLRKVNRSDYLFLRCDKPELIQSITSNTTNSMQKKAPDKIRGFFYFISKIRSEEHTSELQSRPHLVCRLLLEKKKKKKKKKTYK